MSGTVCGHCAAACSVPQLLLVAVWQLGREPPCLMPGQHRNCHTWAGTLNSPSQRFWLPKLFFFAFIIKCATTKKTTHKKALSKLLYSILFDCSQGDRNRKSSQKALFSIILGDQEKKCSSNSTICLFIIFSVFKSAGF